jgi:hypothetical protein
MDGNVYWMAQAMPSLPTVSPTMHLLPGFDEYMLGYTDRSAALDPQYAQKVAHGGNGMFSPTMVIDGRIAGVWKRTRKKKVVVVTTSPFAPLNETEQRSLAGAAERYGRFMGVAAELSS